MASAGIDKTKDGPEITFANKYGRRFSVDFIIGEFIFCTYYIVSNLIRGRTRSLACGLGFAIFAFIVDGIIFYNITGSRVYYGIPSKLGRILFIFIFVFWISIAFECFGIELFLHFSENGFFTSWPTDSLIFALFYLLLATWQRYFRKDKKSIATNFLCNCKCDRIITYRSSSKGKDSLVLLMVPLIWSFSAMYSIGGMNGIVASIERCLSWIVASVATGIVHHGMVYFAGLRGKDFTKNKLVEAVFYEWGSMIGMAIVISSQFA